MVEMSEQSDQILINKTLKGDTAAFALLVDRYQHLVYTLSYRMLKIHEDTEEVAQDIFVKAFQKLHTFKGTSKFSTWIYRISYNTCVDVINKRQKAPQMASLETNYNVSVDKIDGILSVIESKEINDQIEACIQELGEDEAFLITLYYLNELSHEEIAEITGQTKNNIKVKLFRSRKKLYSIMVARLPKEIIACYERN